MAVIVSINNEFLLMQNDRNLTLGPVQSKLTKFVDNQAHVQFERE